MFVFGGINAGPTVESPVLDRIWRVNIASGEVITLPSRLPSGRAETTAVSIGDVAYIIGGTNRYSENLLELVAFNMTTQTLAGSPVPIPGGGRGAAAVAVGERIVISGGAGTNGCCSPNIFTVKPATGEVQQWVTPFDGWSEKPGALLVQGEPYLFAQDKVFRLDVDNQTTIPLVGRLPIRFSHMSLGADQDRVYLLGAYDGHRSAPEIVQYNVSSGMAKKMGSYWQNGRSGAYVWDGQTLWVAGGTDVANRLAKYSPRVPAPRDAQWIYESAGGTLTLTWKGPGASSDMPGYFPNAHDHEILAYEILEQTNAATTRIALVGNVTEAKLSRAQPNVTNHLLIRAIDVAGPGQIATFTSGAEQGSSEDATHAGEAISSSAPTPANHTRATQGEAYEIPLPSFAPLFALAFIPFLRRHEWK